MVKTINYPYDEVIHKNKKTNLSVGNDRFDEMVSKIGLIFNYQEGRVPEGYDHRPDLISDIFFNAPDQWWMILLMNNIWDPFEKLNVGDKIFLPKT